MFALTSSIFRRIQTFRLYYVDLFLPKDLIAENTNEHLRSTLNTSERDERKCR